MKRLAGWTVAVFLLGGHPGIAQSPAGAEPEEKPFFEFSLSEVAAKAVPQPPHPPALPLSEARARALLARLPPLPEQPPPGGGFLREKSLPPPRTGAVVREAFPPAPMAVAPPTIAAPPLRILRRAPEGDVEIAPRLSIAFSQPLGSLAESGAVDAAALPVRLSPTPAGQWRWLTTNLLVFEPEGRFPMATEYRVEVLAGTRSAPGGVLESAETWSFTTPPPSLRESLPQGGPVGRDPLFYAEFDQRIDPEAVLATARVTADVPLPALRLATPDEIAADSNVSWRAAHATAGRWLAFRATSMLPYDTGIDVSLGPGTPSAEGPLKAEQAAKWHLWTYGPLRVLRAGCRPCRPGSSFDIEFTNPIDVRRFSKDMVHVEPALEDLKVVVGGSRLTIMGEAKGGTAYRVSLASALGDTFGQTLGSQWSDLFTVEAPPPPPPVAKAPPPLVPRIWSVGPRLAVLDPDAPLRHPVFSRGFDGLKIRLFAVRPKDWSRFSCAPGAQPPGRLVSTRDVAIEQPQATTEYWVDIAPALRQGLGHVLLIAESRTQPDDPKRRQKLCLWLQSTRLMLDAFADDKSLIVSATTLGDAAPLADVDLRLEPSGIRARTDAGGLATLELSNERDRLLIARRGRDSAILTAAGAWSRRPPEGALRFYVFDPQRLYRPGDEVRVKGFLRYVSGGAQGDLLLPKGVASKVSYRLDDEEGNELLAGERPLSPYGAFDLSLVLPATVNLGGALLHLEADAPAQVPGRELDHDILIQEFRRPEYEIKASASEGVSFVGQSTTVTVAASYYAGGALRDAPVTWNVTARRGAYQPPNREGFIFGESRPWWRGYGSREGSSEQEFTARTDALGTHRLKIDFGSADPPGPVNVHVAAEVTDVNRQARTAAVDVLVHAADLYVGLRPARQFAWEGRPAAVDVIVTDLEGNAVADRPVDVHLDRLDWEQVEGRWTRIVRDRQQCAVVSALEPVRCTFETKRRGDYRVTAVVRDDEGRSNQTTAGLWGAATPPDRPGTEITLMADKESYGPGETAEVLVVSPLASAEGTLTLRRTGIVRAEHFTMSGPSHTLRVKIEEAFTPNVHLQVDLLGREAVPPGTAPESGQPTRLRSLTGQLDLAVPPEQRRLALDVLPRQKLLGPGEQTTLDVAVKDAAGRPVAATDVAVAMVDEALLSLVLAASEDEDDSSTPSSDAVWDLMLPDPLGVFYEAREAGGAETGLRERVVRGGRHDTISRSFGGLAWVGLAWATGDLSLTHEAIGCFVAGRFPLVDAVIEPSGSVARARVYFKSALGEDYFFVEMALENGILLGKLPKPQLAASPITYYLQVTTTDFQEAQTDEIEAVVVADASECPGGRVADTGPPGAPTVFSAATASLAATAGFAAGGSALAADLAIPLRSDFRALALFAPSVLTDGEGRASVELQLPDNLTRYRVLALAAEGNRFGRAQASVTARLPLMVRPSPPRFLSFGDRFELPVVVQNQTDTTLEAELAVRSQNASLAEGAGRRVSVPPNDRVEVLFPMAAGQPGMARIQAAVASGPLADAAERTLPVWMPATSEAVAAYGQIDEGAQLQPVGLPRGVVGDFGGLEISTSSTALSSLTDAFVYLQEYPFECSEQLASRILAVAALRDVLSAFQARGLPAADAIEAAVGRDVERLRQRQRDNGSFGFWRREEFGIHEWPFVTVHVVHALARAKAAGFDIPEEMLDQAIAYLRDVDARGAWLDGLHIFSAQARQALIAYALYVRFLAGDVDRSAARDLAGLDLGSEKASLEALGWLLGILTGDPQSTDVVDAIRAQLHNRITETAAAAHFVDDYGDAGYLLLQSDYRADAVVLESLIADQPESDLIPKLVEGLLGQRRAGRWESTQENAFVLTALARYFRTYEKASPDFVARLWLGPEYAGEHRFHGRSTDRHRTEVPMAALLGLEDGRDVVIEKRGQGRLYYRIGLDYAPASLSLDPVDRGFAVERSYEALDDPQDVVRDSDRRWRIRAGARVRVRVRMTVPATRHHVALVDPMPAGLEALNPELDVAGEDDEEASGRPWWRSWWCWFDHQNLRDERAEVFASELDAGVYDYTYVARATTPGEFVVGPPRAEEMYHPETFGRGVSARVQVR